MTKVYHGSRDIGVVINNIIEGAYLLKGPVS
jgi:hypothetical protein